MVRREIETSEEMKSSENMTAAMFCRYHRSSTEFQAPDNNRSTGRRFRSAPVIIHKLYISRINL